MRFKENVVTQSYPDKNRKEIRGAEAEGSRRRIYLSRQRSKHCSEKAARQRVEERNRKGTAWSRAGAATCSAVESRRVPPNTAEREISCRYPVSECFALSRRRVPRTVASAARFSARSRPFRRSSLVTCRASSVSRTNRILP